jgi:hypothetical protein
MLPLVITSSIKVESFANGYGGVDGSARHIIIIEGHLVIGRCIMIVSSFLPFHGVFLFI